MIRAAFDVNPPCFRPFGVRNGGSFAGTIEHVLGLDGDTDTVAAIAGPMRGPAPRSSTVKDDPFARFYQPRP